MNIDRVARGMTVGRPKEGFTERVMAPLYGRPRPGFTARVMGRIDEPAAGRRSSSGAWVVRPAFAAFGLVLLATGVMILRTGSPFMPAIPEAPRVAALPHLPAQAGALPVWRNPSAVPVTPRVRTTRAPLVAQVIADVPVEAPPIYTISALDGPADIAMKPIGPAAPVIAPLEGPAPLKINEIKEKS